MSRIAIVTDGQGWVVDRISRIYQRHIPGVEVFYHSAMTADGLVYLANHFDLIHFNNFFVEGLQPFFSVCPVPTVISVRSFRYGEAITQLTPTLFHVIHPDMLPSFSRATCIPDGIDLERFKPARRFRVGMACHPMYSEFKGLDMLREAAAGLDVDVVHAADLPHEEMAEFYRSLDLYVCASESEGFSAPLAECMAMNIPVMSTRTGIATYLSGLHVVDRNVQALREGLLAHVTRHRIAELSWPTVCVRIENLYQGLIADRPDNRALAAAQKAPAAIGSAQPYSYVIDRHQHRMNDEIFDALKPKISGRWLDIGCNIGVLLEEVPNGVGVDASELMVAEAVRRGRDVRLADACHLPFADKEFDTVVLSCVLEQIPDWRAALAEAKRVGRRVIGINPIPGASQWGVIQGAVKSIIPPIEIGGVISYPPIVGKYIFEIAT